jgi:NADPH-dependent ferric siderophore reductase
VCGLERMVASVRDLLRKQMGVPREQVHSERYD